MIVATLIIVLAVFYGVNATKKPVYHHKALYPKCDMSDSKKKVNVTIIIGNKNHTKAAEDVRAYAEKEWTPLAKELTFRYAYVNHEYLAFDGKPTKPVPKRFALQFYDPEYKGYNKIPYRTNSCLVIGNDVNKLANSDFKEQVHGSISFGLNAIARDLIDEPNPDEINVLVSIFEPSIISEACGFNFEHLMNMRIPPKQLLIKDSKNYVPEKNPKIVGCNIEKPCLTEIIELLRKKKTAAVLLMDVDYDMKFYRDFNQNVHPISEIYGLKEFKHAITDGKTLICDAYNELRRHFKVIKKFVR